MAESGGGAARDASAITDPQDMSIVSMPYSDRPDFILVSEFCELVGPKPVFTIPSKIDSAFNQSDFVLRIMAADYQTQIFAPGTFRVLEDTQVFLEEPTMNSFAYNHFLTLFDLYARGYVRPWSISYITQDPEKIMTHFAEILTDIASVTEIIKFANRRKFLEELRQRRADLVYTHDMLLQSQALGRSASERRESSLPSSPATPMNSAISPLAQALLASQSSSLAFSAAEIPGALEKITAQLADIDAIVAHVEPLTRDPKLLKRVEDEEELQRGLRGTQPSVFSAHLSPSISTNSMQAFARSRTNTDGSPLVHHRGVHLRGDRPRAQSEVQDSDVYKPKFFNVLKPRDFDRSMKSLEELCGAVSHLATRKLRKIHGHYQRDTMVLQMEIDEAPLLAHQASLLTVGRCVVLNFHLKPPGQSAISTHAMSRTQSKLKKNLFAEQTVPSPEPSDEESEASGPSRHAKQWFNSDYLLSTSPMSQSIYLDAMDEFHSVNEFSPDKGSSVDAGSMYSLDPSGGGGSPMLARKLDSVSNSRQAFESHQDAYSGSGKLDDIEEDKRSRSMSVRTTDSYDSALNTLPEGTPLRNQFTIRKSKKPFQSSADHVCHMSERKPGTGILDFCNHYKFAHHLIFSLLSGRLVVVRGAPENEKKVRALITSLWVFVPGHSTRQQVVQWRANQGPTLVELSRVKLMGLSKCATPGVLRTMESYVTVLDYESETLVSPRYIGVFVKSMVENSKQWENNESFLAHIHQMFLQIASKAFLYYHLYCLKADVPADFNALQVEQPRKGIEGFLKNIDVKDGDVDVVCYFAEIVKMQQAAEFMRLEGHEEANVSADAPAPLIRLDFRKNAEFNNRKATTRMPANPFRPSSAK